MLIARGQFTLYETTDAYAARVDPPVWQVVCDAAGTPQPGELGAGGRATFTVAASRGDRALQMVRSSQPATEGRCHWRALSAAGCTVGATGDTQFYLTAISADQAAVALIFDFEGREQQTRTLQVTKQRPGADGEDGEPAQYVYFFSGYKVAPGVEISLTGGANLAAKHRGFNCVTLDRQTLEVRESRWFDTYSDRTGANVVENMKAWLDALDGTVFLCIASYDYVNWSPTTGDDLEAALREFGLQRLPHKLKGYWPFNFMGYRGLEPGYAAMAQTPETTTVTELQRTLELVVYTAGGAIATQRVPSGILSVENLYAASQSATAAPTSGWSPTPPQMTATKRYLWNYEVIHYTDDTTSETAKRVIGVYGDTGKPGVGIEGITEYYLASASATGVTTATAGWSTTPQQTTPEKPYLWNYEVVRYTDGTLYTSTPAVIGTRGESGAVARNLAGLVTDLDQMRTAEWEGRWYAGGGNGIAHRPDGVNAFGLDVSRTAQGWWSQILTPGDALTNTQWMRAYGNGVWTAWVEKGKDGTNGTPGQPGEDGRTPYVHFAYANSADGSVGFSTTDSAGKLYIGQYVDYTQADSTNPGMYSWTRIKGDQGPGALQMVIEGQTILPATGGTTTLKARLWQDGAEVDPAGTLFQYDWEIYVDGALYATKSGKQTTWMPGPTTWQTGEIRCTAREKSGSRIASASVTLSLRPADGKPGADGESAQYVYLRGTAHSSHHFDGVTTSTAPALVRTTGGVDLSISSRGLTCLTFDRHTLKVVKRQTFDTLNSTNGVEQGTQMVQFLDGVDDSVLLAVVSWDAYYLDNAHHGDQIAERLAQFGAPPIDRSVVKYRCPFAFLGQRGLPQGYAYMAHSYDSIDRPDESHDVEFSVYVANGAMAYAPAGRKGAMPRLRGEWQSGTTYQNQQDYTDIVLYDGSYYRCIAPSGAVTSATNPKADKENWQPFNEFDNLATGVLLAGKGLIQVLGAGKAFIGQTETGTGWEMTQGQIRHTGTGLALTADGKLQVPNPGALTITGGTTLEAAGRNLLKNSKYQKTTTEYLVQDCPTYEDLVVGERYTLVARMTLSGAAAKLGIWDRGGMSKNSPDVTPDADGVAVAYFTFAHSRGGLDGIRLYQLNSSSNSSSGSEVTLHWAVLYKGWALPRREWYPAPEEDASAQLTAYKTEVTSELKVMNDQIASKVAQTTFDALGNRVSSAESTLQQHATQIASKVSQTTYEQFQTQTAADIAALGQGSAQNLIPQSRRPSFSGNTLGFTKSYVDDQNLPPGCYTRWSVTKAGDGGYIYARTDNPAGNTRLYPSRTYSWSLHIRSSRALSFRVGHENGGVKSVSLEAGVWTRLTHTFTTSATDQGGAFCIYSRSPQLQPGDTLDFHSLILVEGAVVPQWVPSPWETQQGIDDAQADATDAQNKVGALTTRVTTAESQITQQAGLIAQKVSQTTFETFRTQTDSAVTKAQQAADAAQADADSALTATDKARLLAATAAGNMLSTDPTFKTSTNGILKYNNSAVTAVTVTRKALGGAPNDSGYVIEVVNNGGTSLPGRGGFTFSTKSRANLRTIARFVAKIPKGYTLDHAANSTGEGAAGEWLTDNKGTGDWAEYAWYYKCGATGTFSTFNFFYLSGSPDAVTWQLAYAAVFDITSAGVTPAERDQLVSRMTTAESTLTQQANLIAQKVAQTTFDTFRTGVDTFKQQTNQSLSEIRQTASGIQSTVTSHTTQLTQLGTKIDKAAPYAEATLDATALDPDTWYPVTVGLQPDRQYTIRVLHRLNAAVVPPWATHRAGYSVLAAWQSNGSAYGEQVVKRTILEYTQNWANGTVLGRIGQLTHTSEEHFYVRGGGQYRVEIRDARPSKAIALHTSDYTSDSSAPETLPLLTAAPDQPVPDLDKAQQAADEAQADADSAQTAADAAKSSAQSALTQLANMSSDNILSPVEKQQTKKEWDAIAGEYTKNTAAASTAGVSYTNYSAAYQTLSTYITPLLTSLTTDSSIAGTTFRQKFKAYYDARTDLLNAIAKAARDKANAAQSAADQAQSRADSAYQSAQNANTKADGAVTIRDTRADNQPPSWYLENYGSKVVREFKYTEAIGLKAAFPGVVTETFCTLETYVQWGDSSGGYPRQTAYSQGRLFTRYGTSATAWSAWRDSTTTLEVETQIDQARDRLWLGVTSNLLNLFRDGSFERDVNTVSNTDAGASAVSFPAWRDIYEPYDATTSGKYRDVMPQSARVMAIRNWASGAARVILGQHVPVEPGKTYTIILWRHDGGSRTAQDGVRWLNVRTPEESPTWTSVELADQQTAWAYGWHREYFVVGPAPASAQSLQVFLGTASSTAAAWTLVDGLMVVEGDLRAAGLVPETFVDDLRSDFSNALYETGINIATGEITVQADRFRIKNQNGGAGELLFDTSTGLLRTELIDAEALTVRNLSAGRGTIDFLAAPEPGTGGMGVYIGRGAFEEALSSTADYSKAKGASLTKTFSHASGATGAVNGAMTDHTLYTVTAGAAKAATVRIAGSVRVDLAATGRLDSASFGRGVVNQLAKGSVSAALVLVVDGTTQKFIANSLRCAAPTWDSEYVGGVYVLSNPQNSASASFTVAVDETVSIPAGSQAKVVLRYSYRLDRKSSSFTANARITASQASNSLNATVQTRLAALCADGLMLQTSTANYLRLIPGTYSDASRGFRLESDSPLQLAAPTAMNRLSHKTITTAMTGVGGNSSDIAFWAGYALFIFDRPAGERFLLPDVNISPRVNHLRLYTRNSAKVTTQGTDVMGGTASGNAEFTTRVDQIYTLDYIESLKRWVIQLG